MQFSLMASFIAEVREKHADESVFLIQTYIASSVLLQFLHIPLGTKFGTMAWGACSFTAKGAVNTLKIVW